MKACRKCNIEKPINEYYVHKQMADGHLNICKECVRLRVTTRYEKDIEKIKAYEKSRAKLPHRVKACREYQKTENGKASRAKSFKKYKEKHTNRYFARIAFANAVRDGKLEKMPCFICGDKKSQGHHPDYSRPLDVVWLCIKHHVETHKLTKEQL